AELLTLPGYADAACRRTSPSGRGIGEQRDVLHRIGMFVSGVRTLSALREVVKFGGVVDEDTVAYRLVGRPIEHQVDQDRIVRLGFGISHARVWPVAAPD